MRTHQAMGNDKTIETTQTLRTSHETNDHPSSRCWRLCYGTTLLVFAFKRLLRDVGPRAITHLLAFALGRRLSSMWGGNRPPLPHRGIVASTLRSKSQSSSAMRTSWLWVGGGGMGATTISGCTRMITSNSSLDRAKSGRTHRITDKSTFMCSTGSHIAFEAHAWSTVAEPWPRC
jgi:hypothetical protein